MDRNTQRPTLPCAAARPARPSDRLVVALDDGITIQGPANALRDLAASLRAPVGVRLLREQLAEALEEQSGETQGAAGDDSGVHTPNVLRASGARKSAP